MRRRPPLPPAVPWHPARPLLEQAYRTDPRGRVGPTPGQARGRFWRAVGKGWYRPVEPAATVEQRIVEASYPLPAYGGVTGWAALRWSGGRWFDGVGPGGELRAVPLAIHASNRAHWPGVALSKERMRPDELTVVDGLAVTTLARACLFEMRYAPSLEAAVVALDMACFNDLVSLAEVAVVVAQHRAWTGIPRAREALGLARENSWSPQETHLRLLWGRETGRDRLRCNAPVFDADGRHLLTPDLLDEERGVVGEYDGLQHLSRAHRRGDAERVDRLRDLGLEVVVVLAGQSRAEVAARVRAAYARAARRPADDRRWTLRPPAWWRPLDTVAQRRELGAADRARLLRHRAA